MATDANHCVKGHTAYVFDRGARTQLFKLADLAEVRWNRIRDDISESNVKIAARNCYAQADNLNSVEPGRHELVIFRGKERKWEGPISRAQISARGIEFHAKDVVHYLSRTNLTQAYSNKHPNSDFALERVKDLLTELVRLEAEEAAAYPDLPSRNVMPFVTFNQDPTDARTSRFTARYQKTIWEEIDDMAAKGGIDYTTVGRAIHFWDTSKPLGELAREITQNDLLGDLVATHYGMDLKTRAVVTDGEGNYGEAGGVHPYYGLVENLETAYDESEGTDPPTSAEMASQAARNLVLRIPDNSGIRLSETLTIDDLVPGVFVRVRAKLLIRDIVQKMKLDAVNVIEDGAGEKVTVKLSPATQPDEPEEA
jgi:hypothetical protein